MECIVRGFSRNGECVAEVRVTIRSGFSIDDAEALLLDTLTEDSPPVVRITIDAAL